MKTTKAIALSALCGLVLAGVAYGAHWIAEGSREPHRASEERLEVFGELDQAAGTGINQKCPNMSQVGQEPGPANYWPNGYPGPTF